MGKPLHVLWEKPTDAGSYTGGDWVSGGGLSLGNLTTQDVMEVARSTDATENATWWRVDFGRLMPLSLFAIINHNGSTTARRRHVVTNSATNSGSPVYDTGDERMWTPTEVWGAKPFGSFTFEGIDSTAYPGGTVDLHVAPQTVYGRYVFTYISDTDNPSGYFQAGRFMAGDAWQRRMAYGVKLRTVDPSQQRRTRGGKRVVRAQPRYRQMTISFERMSEKDAMAVAFEIDRQVGKRGDFLLVYDPDDAGPVRFRRTIYASLVDTAGVISVQPNGRYNWSIDAEELI